MKQRMPFLLAALVLLLPCTALAETAWKLRTLLNEGDSQRYALSQIQSMDLVMGEMKQSMESSSRIEFLQKVKNRSGDEALVMDVVYERMQSQVDLGGMALKFDTADADSSKHPMARMQQQLVDRHFSMTVSTRGQVQEVQGFDAILDGMSDALADDPSMARTMEAIREGFDDEAMTGMMQQGLAVFPEHEVKVGDSWEHRARMRNPALGELNVISEYRLQGSEKLDGRDCLKLAVSSTVEFDNQGQMFDQLRQLFAAEIDVKIGDASGTGTILVDGATGIIVDSELRQRITMDIAMQLPDGAAPTNEMAIRGSVTQAVRMELLE